MNKIRNPKSACGISRKGTQRAQRDRNWLFSWRCLRSFVAILGFCDQLPKSEMGKQAQDQNPRPLIARVLFGLRISSFGFRVFVPLLLGGCAVGHNFKKPEAPPEAGFTPKPLRNPPASAVADGGGAQHFVPGQDIPCDWWKAFECPELDSLVDKALRANPTIASAKAA